MLKENAKVQVGKECMEDSEVTTKPTTKNEQKNEMQIAVVLSNVRTYISTCTYVHTYVRVHTYVYIHMHTQLYVSNMYCMHATYVPLGPRCSLMVAASSSSVMSYKLWPVASCCKHTYMCTYVNSNLHE